MEKENIRKTKSYKFLKTGKLLYNITKKIVIFCVVLSIICEFNKNIIIFSSLIINITFISSLILCKIGFKEQEKENKIFKERIENYNVIFNPCYKKTSIRFKVSGDKFDNWEFINYDKLNLSEDLIKRLKKFDKQYDRLLEICENSDNYNKINQKINEVNREYCIIYDLLRDELSYEYKLDLNKYFFSSDYLVGYSIDDYYDSNCGQGILRIKKDITTNKYYIFCDECSLVWDNPIDAMSGNNYLINEDIGKFVDVTYQEIKELGWDKYVKEKKN